jgi:hypothetical protein
MLISLVGLAVCAGVLSFRLIAALWAYEDYLGVAILVLANVFLVSMAARIVLA